jgi:ABC-type xylose transport system permease subunit
MGLSIGNCCALQYQRVPPNGGTRKNQNRNLSGTKINTYGSQALKCRLIYPVFYIQVYLLNNISQLPITVLCATALVSSNVS